jgi:hypothetical protein
MLLAGIDLTSIKRRRRFVRPGELGQPSSVHGAAAGG